MKSPAKSLTVWFNVVMLALMLPEVRALLPESWVPYHAALVAVGNLLLRLRTSQPVAFGGRG
jgi:hypothetical protein